MIQFNQREPRLELQYPCSTFTEYQKRNILTAFGSQLE